MQITVLGASGNVGKIVVELLLQQGHFVIGQVHRHNPFLDVPNLQIVAGDINDEQTIFTAIEGSVAVISCLGSWGTPTKDVLTKAMQTLIPAMEQFGHKRLISLTGVAAFMPNEQVSLLDRTNRAFLRMLQPKILADAEAHAKLLHDSSLEWTILRSPVMIKRDISTYQLRMKLPAPWATISYRAVATALKDQITDSSYLHEAPAIHSK